MRDGRKNQKKERKKHEFLSGFFVGFSVVVMLAAILLDIAIWKYGDTMESIYVLAKNAIITSVNKEEKEEEFSSIEVAAKLDMLNAYIKQYYLHDSDTKAEKEAVYKAVVTALSDPYSVYYTKEEYEKMNETFEGSYVGIGVTAFYNKKTKEISVDEITTGSGAETAGLKIGDIFYEIDGESTKDMDLSELASKLKGEAGSKVSISVLRDGESLEFTVERKEISLQTVKHTMLEDKMGYIEISRFSQTTPEQFDEAIEKLLFDGMEGLVIDLRENGGGSLSAVVDMLDRMLPEGLLVYTKTKQGEKKEYYSTDKQSFEKPFAVLINENSASASEIFAGAIKDREAGILVGTTSFGKGIVQKIYVLDDGSAIKLTNSEYFTPNGNNIHGIGIAPDIEVKAKKGKEKGSEQDIQLAKAVELIRTKIKE